MEDILIRKLSFIQRPIPIPADYRPMYKISIIVLILKLSCRGETSTLLKLHLLSWALSNEKNKKELQEYIDSDFKLNFSVWGIEPALNRALAYAVAEKICIVVDSRNYKLAEKGHALFNLIADDPELFSEEKSFLASIGKNTITDKRINLISLQWSLPYA